MCGEQEVVIIRQKCEELNEGHVMELRVRSAGGGVQSKVRVLWVGRVLWVD